MGPDEQNVDLLQFDRLFFGGPAAGRCVGLGLYALVVVVDGHRQRLLGDVLADHVRVEEGADLTRLGQIVEQADISGLGELLFDDLVAEIDALVGDVHWTSDQLLDLLLALSAERAFEQFGSLSDSRHDPSSSRARHLGPPRRNRKDARQRRRSVASASLSEVRMAPIDAVLDGLFGGQVLVALDVTADLRRPGRWLRRACPPSTTGCEGFPWPGIRGRSFGHSRPRWRAGESECGC